MMCDCGNDTTEELIAEIVGKCDDCGRTICTRCSKDGVCEDCDDIRMHVCLSIEKAESDAECAAEERAEWEDE